MKVAIVGAGGGFAQKRIQAITRCKDDLVGLCDLQLERIEKQQALSEVFVTSDYRELAKIDVDIVVISVSDDAKLDTVSYFLAAGKHVIVEKPLLLTKNEISKLYDLARSNQAVLYIGYNLNFFPSIQKLKSLIAQKYFGDVHHVRMFYGHGGVHAQIRNQGWRVNSHKSWGGAFVDMGVHLLDLATQVISKVDDGKIECQHVFSKSVEDHCTGILRSGKCIIDFTSSWTAWRNRFSCEIYGSKGFAEIDGLVKYTKYGQVGESIRYGKSNPHGAPKVNQLLYTVPQTTKYFTHEMIQHEVDSFSADVEFLDHEWTWLKEKIETNTFDLDHDEHKQLLIADVYERFYLQNIVQYS